MPKLDLDAIPQTNRTGYPPPFDEPVQGRWYRRLAPVGGLTKLGASHVVLKPGAWSSQRHWHAGEDELSKEMTLAAVTMRQRINEDYRGRQMRIEHSISVGDLRTAQKQIKILVLMLDGQQGPDMTWLAMHDRRLALRLGKPQ